MSDKKEEVELEDEEIVTLTGEDGEEMDFLHLATFDHKDKWYVVLQEIDEDCKCEKEECDCTGDEVVILELSEDENGEDLFLPIEDEKLLEEVFNAFQKFSEEE